MGPPFRAGRRLALGAAHAALVLSLLSSSGVAQGGWVTEKHPDLGLTFPRARNYEQIPTPPDEIHVVLHFAEKIPGKAKDKKEIRPELEVVWIEKTSETPGGEGTAPAGASKKSPPIDSLSRYVESLHPEWNLGTAVAGKRRGDHAALEYTWTPGREVKEPRAGWIYAYENERRVIAFLGVCGERDLIEQVKIWRRTAEGVEFSEPEEWSVDRLERMYDRLALPNPDYRISVRKKLVRGWRAEDTEHYIVIYDTTDEPLVRKIVRDLEPLNAEYRRLFPPAQAIEAVSTVRICKDADEYRSFGGDERTSGHWNAASEELVLYDQERVENHVKIDTDTFRTLYHEAFHQYIHYACGELPPHLWFNEGHGDYFAGARIKDGKVRSIDPVPTRLQEIQSAVAHQRFVPWKDLIRFEQAQYYAPEIVSVCYAQGWSMIYFLRKSKDVEKRPEWLRIIPTYFETLKHAYRAEIAALPDGGKAADRVALAKAGLEARRSALDAAFAGVDLAEIENAWIGFIRGLEAPGDR